MKKYKYDKVFTFEGKRYHVYADTLEEVGRKKAEKIQKIKSAKSKTQTDITVEVWTEKCFETYKSGQAEITRKKYTNRVRYCILRHIGFMRIKDVTSIHCQEVLNYQRGNSRSQINEVYNALRFIFSRAVFNDLIDRDPTLSLQKPKGTYNPRRALTEKERKTLIKVASKDRRFFCFLLMLFCGCRPAEACSCIGADISENADGFPILHIKGTKTKNADRFVPIPTELYALIKDTPKKEFISTYSTGTQIKESNRARLWKSLWRQMNIEAGTKTYRNALLEPYEIPKDLTPYCLRHEYCSDLARRGVDIRVAQRLMGHSDISLTANIYTHIDNNLLSSVAEVLG